MARGNSKENFIKHPIRRQARRRREQLSQGEKKAQERLASRAPRQRKAEGATSAEAPIASAQASAAGTEPLSLDSIFLSAADMLQASELLAQLSDALDKPICLLHHALIESTGCSCSKASSAASAQPDGTSTPAAPVAESTFVSLPTCSSQEEVAKLPSSSQTIAEPASTSTQDIETDSSALPTATEQPSLAASGGEQGTAATGASAMPAGKTAKPAETSLPVRRRQRKPASPRSGMPRAEFEMPAPEKPVMQRTHTGSHTQPPPGVQEKQPTKKCRKGLENQAPQTTATAQPKARTHRKTRTAEKQRGGGAHSIEPINVAATPLQTRSRKRTRAALAEMENSGTAAAAAATAGQATMTAADISTRGIGEEGTPAKRRRDAAATTEAQALPQQLGGSAERQTPSSSAASAGEHGAQQPPGMEVDGVRRGRGTAAGASAQKPAARPRRQARPQVWQGRIRCSNSNSTKRNTNTSTSLENCPPSPLMVKMPQAPLPQLSSLGRAGGAMKAVAEEGVVMEDRGAKAAAGSGRNAQKKRGHREVDELCAAPQRVLRPRRQ
ncbi:g11797 [Coccomyxa elongata]